MRRFLLSSIAVAALSAWAAPASAQIKISGLPNLPTAAASLTDAFPAQSSSCSGGNCRITVQQIIAAVSSTYSAGFSTISTRAAPGGSQAIVFPYWATSNGAQHTTSLYTTGDGSIVVASNDAGNLDLLEGSLFLPSSNGVLVNSNSVVSADSGANVYLGSGNSFQSIALGNGHAGLFMDGPIVIQTQTPSSSAGTCSTGQITFDASYSYACTSTNHWMRSPLASF